MRTSLWDLMSQIEIDLALDRPKNVTINTRDCGCSPASQFSLPASPSQFRCHQGGDISHPVPRHHWCYMKILECPYSPWAATSTESRNLSSQSEARYTVGAQ